MLKVGITGGIGSGKSYICEIFAHLNVPVYNADKAAQVLMESDIKLVEKIKNYFGDKIYNDQGKINRTVLAEKIFNNQEALIYINSQVHPAVAADFELWCNQQTHNQYVLKEAAILFETGSYKHLDSMILILAPEAIRIERVQQRDKSTTEQIKARIAKQWSDSQKEILADFIIYNDGQQMLLPQIIKIHEILSHKSV